MYGIVQDGVQAYVSAALLRYHLIALLMYFNIPFHFKVNNSVSQSTLFSGFNLKD